MVYFADTSGLWVLDAGQFSPAAQVGDYDTPGKASNMAKHGDLLYVADGERGLRILDVSSPANISDVGYLDTPGISQDVVVSGSIAYVADGAEGLRIIDLSTPDSPAEIGVYDQFQDVTALAVTDNTAFLARWGWLPIVDVSIPTSPTLLGGYACSYPVDVVVAQELLLVACGYDGLHILDISSPEEPIHLSTPYGVTGYARLAVSGDTAYVLATIPDVSLTAVDISLPLTPTIQGRIYLPGVERTYDLTIDGDRAYVVTGKDMSAQGDQGLRIVNINNPARMREVGWFDTGADSLGVLSDNGLAYLGLGTAGVSIVDVSHVSGLVEAAHYAVPVLAEAVTVKDDYAYVADYSYGLRIIDVSQPAFPNWVGSLDANFLDPSIVISGDHAYVGEREGLHIIDVSDALRPVQVGQFSMFIDQANAVVLSGTLAYIAGGDGLYIIDVSDSTHPEQLALYRESGGLYDLDLSDNLLYASGSEFIVLDINAPDAPLEVGSCPGTGRIAISGTYAYVATGNETLSVIDISNPALPQVVGSGVVPTYARDVAVIGPYALVADVNYGLRVFDVSNPREPSEVDYYDTPGNPEGIVVEGRLVYVGDYYGGLVILSLEDTLFSYSFLPLLQR
jgi:hypothetical protein